jgi:Zn finger protein HypA/HybF involved in hydrogenase expression
MKVDVEKSLGYQANGRFKKEDAEKANLFIKKFLCPNCHHEEKANKKQFGDDGICPICGSVMIQQY